MPLGVESSDKSDLLFPRPPFDLLFPGDGYANVWIVFIVNQVIAVVLTGKGYFLACTVLPVLLHTLVQVVGNTSIEHRSLRVGCDIEVVVVEFHLV